MPLILSLATILISLYAMGILRTAIWLLPLFVFEGYMEIASLSWLVFFSLVVSMARYKEGAFDLRDWEKDRWSLLFFLTGVISGAFLYPRPWPFFALAAMLPFFFVKLFQSLRMPLTKVQVFPLAFRWIVIVTTIVLGLMNMRIHF